MPSRTNTVLDACATNVSDAHNQADHLGCYGNWAVAQTHPQAERWADQNLRRLGFTTYLPLVAIRQPDRVTPSLTHRVMVPLWPGYVFVQHDNPDLWRPIREAPGVANVLRCGNRIQWVRAGALAHARAVIDGTRYPTCDLVVGAACSVVSGPLAGMSGIVLKVSQEYANVSLMMLGQLRSLLVSLDCLKPREA
jgi:transcriptional antiterminator RfaH